MVHVHAAEQAAPIIQVDVAPPPPAAVTINVPEQPAPQIDVHVPKPVSTTDTIERDDAGRIVKVHKTVSNEGEE